MAMHMSTSLGEIEVTVVKIGTEADFLNRDRVQVKWQVIKRGTKRVYESRSAWVQPGTLTLKGDRRMAQAR